MRIYTLACESIHAICEWNDYSLFFSGSGNFIDHEGFRNALYMTDIGQNDLADSFSKNLTYIEVIKRIPSVISEIKNAVKVSSIFDI